MTQIYDTVLKTMVVYKTYFGVEVTPNWSAVSNVTLHVMIIAFVVPKRSSINAD